jgi:hypothetical protein
MDGMPTTLSVGFLLTEYATPSASQDRTGSCGRHSPCWGGQAAPRLPALRTVLR